MSTKNVAPRFTPIFSLTFGLLFLALSGFVSAQADSPKESELKTIVYEMKNCLNYSNEGSEYVFKSKKEFEAAIWTKSEYCPEKTDDIDFDKYTLLGVDIHNAECRHFLFKHKLIKDEAAKLYRLQVTHPPLQSICAGLYHHTLWILAPKLPAGYDVDFTVNVEKSEEKPEQSQ